MTTAQTRPDHPSRHLRGRRYGLPFDGVWETAVGWATSGSGGVSLCASDEGVGRLVLRHRSLTGIEARVELLVGLDLEGQTRIDMRWTDLGFGGRLPGRGTRGIRRLLGRLHRALEKRGAEALDPSVARALPAPPPVPLPASDDGADPVRPPERPAPPSGA